MKTETRELPEGGGRLTEQVGWVSWRSTEWVAARRQGEGEKQSWWSSWAEQMCSELLNIGHTSPVTVSLPLLNQILAESYTLYIKDYYILSASKQTLLNSPFIMQFREKRKEINKTQKACLDICKYITFSLVFNTHVYYIFPHKVIILVDVYTFV